MWVRVLSADPALARQEDWDGAEGVEALLARLAAAAVAAGVPAQVEVEGQGVWSVSPAGRVTPGRLFHAAKAPRPPVEECKGINLQQE
ncbi:MAG TPA: hypothetical protein VFV36_06900 [Candidatus Methylomirabilis sp.]|nr:hypothetical protein [Candidatus Methylomirabilis sp.]